MAKFLKLQNVVKAAEGRPDTFFIPSEREREEQKAGDSVRLHFLLANPEKGEPSGERMWVTVTAQCDSRGNYVGELQNQPAVIEDLNLGDEIRFKPHHIARITIGKDDPRWLECGDQRAFVSKLCLKGGSDVCFLYREMPDNDEDSGWRMFTGNETDAYANNPDNLSTPDVDYMLDKDPTLLMPLKHGEPGDAFERDFKAALWEKVEDWNPAEEQPLLE